jgi:hypothetical protein
MPHELLMCSSFVPTGLAELDIGDNLIGDEGIIALGAGLENNSTLEQLSIVRASGSMRWRRCLCACSRVLVSL